MLIALPDIFRGIHLDPLAPGNISYLLWMIMGYLVVTAVLVVSFGRLGDMYGRVRMYNAGFAVFTVASIVAVGRPGCTATARRAVADRLARGAGRRRRDADGQLDGDPHRRVPRRAARHWRSASTRSPAIAGSFIGLVLGGVLAPMDWRAVFWVGADRRVRHDLGVPSAARHRRPPARPASTGGATSPSRSA